MEDKNGSVLSVREAVEYLSRAGNVATADEFVRAREVSQQIASETYDDLRITCDDARAMRRDVSPCAGCPNDPRNGGSGISDKLRLLSPRKYKSQMVREFIELFDLGVIRLPYEYGGNDYIQVIKKLANGEEESYTYDLNDEEKLALVLGPKGE